MRPRKPIKFDTTVKPTIHNFRDLTGKTFSRLTVLRFVGIRKSRSFWICRCSCGNKTLRTAIELNGGTIVSCGCYQSEITAARNKAGRTHGHNNRNSPEYRSWNAMKSRCYNPKNNKSKYYRERGVTVCDRWRTFENFLADMGPRPKGTSIDRWPDKNGNYEPSNCRWATPTQQNNNRNPHKPRQRKAA